MSVAAWIACANFGIGTSYLAIGVAVLWRHVEFVLDFASSWYVRRHRRLPVGQFEILVLMLAVIFWPKVVRALRKQQRRTA